jgi:hypothetical protein
VNIFINTFFFILFSLTIILNSTHGFACPVEGCPIEFQCDQTTKQCLNINESHRCRMSKLCEVQGQCTWNGHQCKAVSDDDCQASVICQQSGGCTAVNGVCTMRASSDVECNVSHLCDRLGLCVVKDGHCIAKKESDCKKSDNCSTLGACSYVNHTCQVTTNKECQDSSLCKSEGLCSLYQGACQAITNLDCVQATSCEVYKQCVAQSGLCAKKVDSDQLCQNSSVCKRLGLCSSVKGICQAKTPQHCFQSMHCKDNASCSLFHGRCYTNLKVNSNLYQFANQVFNTIKTLSVDDIMKALIYSNVSIEELESHHNKSLDEDKKDQGDKIVRQLKRHYEYFATKADRIQWEKVYPQYANNDNEWERWKKRFLNAQQRKKDSVLKLVKYLKDSRVDISQLRLLNVVFESSWKRKYHYYHSFKSSIYIVLIIQSQTTQFYVGIGRFVKTDLGDVLLDVNVGITNDFNPPSYPSCRKDQHCKGSRINKVCVDRICRDCREDKDCNNSEYNCVNHSCILKQKVVK